MTSFPVVDRELRVTARKPATYHNRVVIAGLAGLLSAWVSLTAGRGLLTSQAGQEIFQSLSIFAFVLCLLGGARLTADTLSQERREGTLGLLLLTPLRIGDVVLGKLTAAALNAAYALVTIIPVLSLALLLGGVSLGEFSRTILTLANTLWFSLTAGLWVSSFSTQAFKALGGSFFVLLWFTVIWPWAGFELTKAAPGQPWIDYLFFVPNPAFTFASAVGFSAGWKEFRWSSLVVTHLMAWGFLWLACRNVGGDWSQRPALPTDSRRRFSLWLQRDAEFRCHTRGRLAGQNPVAWLLEPDSMEKIAVWTTLLMFYLIWFWQLYRQGNAWLSRPVVVMTLLMTHGILKVWIAVRATGRFADDRRTGALAILLGTSLSTAEIKRGHAEAVRRQFGWPVLAVVGLDLVVLWCEFLAQRSISTRWWLLAAGGIGVLFLDLWAITRVGLWQSVYAKNAITAVSTTLWLVLILPWGIALLLLSPLLYQHHNFATLLGAGWVITSVAVDCGCVLSANAKLDRELRLRGMDTTASESTTRASRQPPRFPVALPSTNR